MTENFVYMYSKKLAKLINVGIKKKHILDNFYLKIHHDIHGMSVGVRNNFNIG